GISFFNRLIDRHPYSLEAWFNLGVSYINAGQYDKALEALDFAIAIDDGHDHSWFHKGYVLNLLERYPEALEAFTECMGVDETDPLKYYYLGEVSEKMDDFKKALTYYQKATELDPDVTDAWVGMGVCELENDNPKTALWLFEKGLELDPENTSYLCLLANTRFALGMKEEAAAAYEKALELDPNDQDTWLEYADIVASDNHLEDASEIMRRGNLAIPGNASLIYHLSAYLFLAGKEREGSYYLEEALTKDFPEHAKLLEKFPRLLMLPSFMDTIELYRS
ncbi:MAG: tetratricopeptide repeat protein, partial [Bacteroidales bacterium]